MVVRKIVRSAETGKIVPVKQAKTDPKGTVTETQKSFAQVVKQKLGKFKIPKKIGAIADMLYSTRQERLEVNRVVEEFKERETQLKDYIIENLPKSDATGASGKLANVRVVNDSQYRVEDWDLFYAHIKKTGHFDLLNRAINQTAIGERFENGKPVPGIGTYVITKVSVTKV